MKHCRWKIRHNIPRIKLLFKKWNWGRQSKRFTFGCWSAEQSLLGESHGQSFCGWEENFDAKFPPGVKQTSYLLDSKPQKIHWYYCVRRQEKKDVSVVLLVTVMHESGESYLDGIQSWAWCFFMVEEMFNLFQARRFDNNLSLFIEDKIQGSKLCSFVSRTQSLRRMFPIENSF